MSLKATREYRRSPKGVLTNMYDHMRRRHSVEFTLKEFHERFLTDRRFLRLHAEWVEKGFDRSSKPSLDRINRKKPYTIRNTQMLTWAENRYKQTMERRSRKGVVIQLLNGRVVGRYLSQREAVRVTGLTQGLISNVLNGRRNHTGGYQFVYEHAEGK